MANLKLKYSVNHELIILDTGSDSCTVRYPKNMLKDFGQDNSQRIAENIIFLFTMPFGLNKDRLSYKSRPFFEKLICTGILKDIPGIAESINEDTNKLLADFEEIDLEFEDNDVKKLSIEKDTDQTSVILGMSFGK